MTGPAVTVVVPTRNSARTLEACLRSIRSQGLWTELIVVDNHSTDESQQIASELADQVIIAGPERSRQRNLGAASGTAAVVAFIDSDMILNTGVLTQCLEVIRAGAGAVVIPERTIGEGLVCRARAFERSFYAEGSGVEAARVFRRDVLVSAGGFDEQLLGPEDWDLHIRVAGMTTVGRVSAVIDHDEGHVGFLDACRKKAYYAHGMRRFIRKHGRRGVALAGDRPWLRQPWRLARRPLLGGTLVCLKAGESAAMLWRLRSPAPPS